MNNQQARRHLAAILRRNDLTQQNAAALIGVETTTVERWLAGRAIPQTRREWFGRITVAGTGTDALLTVHQDR